ncbi:MAG: response regulator [Candidatus Aminicenantes bacterium]|jgi:DNA-binding response OmpR family regulator
MYKIIVADCSPSVLSAVRMAFSPTEFEIQAFSDGAEVIKALEKTKPDAILLNLYLDSKDGYEACFILNTQERFKNIPLFLLKGAFDPVDEERISGLEYRELIEEPFDSQLLAQKVRGVLRRDSDPLSLPEEPVLAESQAGTLRLDERIKALVSEEFFKAEERIAERLKSRVLDEVRKEQQGKRLKDKPDG